MCPFLFLGSMQSLLQSDRFSLQEWDWVMSCFLFLFLLFTVLKTQTFIVYSVEDPNFYFYQVQIRIWRNFFFFSGPDPDLTEFLFGPSENHRFYVFNDNKLVASTVITVVTTNSNFIFTGMGRGTGHSSPKAARKIFQNHFVAKICKYVLFFYF